MQIAFTDVPPPEYGALVIFIDEGGVCTSRVCGQLCMDQIHRAMRATGFKGDAGELIELVAPAGIDAERLVIAGVGNVGRLTSPAIERIAGQIIERLDRSGSTLLTVDFDSIALAANEAATLAANFALGATLQAYNFDRYRTETAPPISRLEQGRIVTRSWRAARARFAKLAPVADGVFLSRDLASEPPNALSPRTFAERVQACAVPGVQVEVIGQAEMERLGFGAFLGVAQGSAHEPQLVILSYSHGARRGDRPLLLVGKGITFDAGGISIKPAANMHLMKYDMAGAAVVAGAINAVASLELRGSFVGICAMAENMPSASAQRPGDIVTSYSGRTIEIIDTDCEGRLVLCDAVAYAQQRFNPAVAIDVATLTSAVVVALGDTHAGLFCNDGELQRELLTAGEATGETLWPLPLGENYAEQLKSNIADLKNVAGPDGSASIAAEFIRAFIEPGVAWAHLDISGTAWARGESSPSDKGPTGYGVRLLVEYASSVAAGHKSQPRSSARSRACKG